ncbi:Uncharacterised protein [Vibrio cholerae]|nr:Uncharacterised protein [Vibrio cholerae]
MASSRSTSGERRSSPNLSASALISFLSRLLRRRSEPSSSSSFLRSFSSSSCSPRIFISSSLAKWRNLVSKIASA